MKGWEFTLDERSMRGRLTLNSSDALLSAMLFTRVYHLDNNVIDRYYHSTPSATSGGSGGQTSVLLNGVQMSAQANAMRDAAGLTGSSTGLVVMIACAGVLVAAVAPIVLVLHVNRRRYFYRGYERI